MKKTVDEISTLLKESNPESVAESLGLDYDAQEDLVLLPGWVADDGNADIVDPDAASGREAAQEYASEGFSDPDESTAVLVHTWRQGVDADGEIRRAEEDTHLIVVHPEEPECAASKNGAHKWSDAHELVGGCESNPGIQSAGGCGIRSLDVCLFCGMAWIRSSATQGEETEFDHDTVRYSTDGDDAVSAETLAEYHDGKIPEGLRSESELWKLLMEANEPE